MTAVRAPQAVLLVMAVFSVLGCGPPGQRVELSTPIPVQDVPSTERGAYNRFALRLASMDAAMGADSRVILPSGVHTTLGTLLKAAEGPTWTGIAAALGQRDPDPEKLAAMHRSFEAHWQGLLGRPLVALSSAWLVWPIPLDPVFTREAEAQFGTHLERLGSAGVTAKNTINEWVSDETGGRVGPVVSDLSPLDMMLLISGGDLRLSPSPGLTGVRNGGGRTFLRFAPAPAATGEGWSAVAVPLSGGLRLFAVRPEGPSTLADLVSGLPGLWARVTGGLSPSDEPVEIEAFRAASVVDLSGPLRGMGARTLFEGPVDFRKMSIELYGDYRFASLTHAASIELAAPAGPAVTGEAADVFGGPMIVIVEDQVAGAIIAVATING